MNAQVTRGLKVPKSERSWEAGSILLSLSHDMHPQRVRTVPLYLCNDVLFQHSLVC